MVDNEKRKTLEAAGFQVGDAEDFLGLSEEEHRLVESRVAASRAARRRQEATRRRSDAGLPSGRKH